MTLGEEVDLLVETEDHLRPIEIKAATQPRLAHAAHLRTFQKEYGDRSQAGLLLHTDALLAWIAPNMRAAPWWRVL